MSIATAAGSGSIGGLLLSLLHQHLTAPGEPIVPADLSSAFSCFESEYPIDPKSFVLGLVAGLLAGPVIEILYAAKLWWRRVTLRWWAVLHNHPLALYRVNEQ